MKFPPLRVSHNNIHALICLAGTMAGILVLPVFPCATAATVAAQISDSDDDVEERESDGRVYFDSSDLELVYDTYASQGNQTVGLRFTDLGIPSGVFITEAYLQFTSDEPDDGGLS